MCVKCRIGNKMNDNRYTKLNINITQAYINDTHHNVVLIYNNLVNSELALKLDGFCDLIDQLQADME